MLALSKGSEPLLAVIDPRNLIVVCSVGVGAGVLPTPAMAPAIAADAPAIGEVET